MERRCEFCAALCPIVYCKADAAHLCLSCDSKVHSANALSYRHPRTLVCESCRYYPALIRCFDHEMFMCQNCDANHHVSFQHQKRVISCYVGCPSAKDLAVLWGLDLHKWDSKSVVSRACNSSISKSSCLPTVVSSLPSEMDSMISILYTESQGGSSRLGTKVVRDDNQPQNSCLILQQIQELARLQLSEGLDNSCLVHVKERPCGFLSGHDYTKWKVQKSVSTRMEQSSVQLEFQNGSSPVKAEEPMSLPFSQLENLTSTGNLLQGDSYWQCKSPLHNNEIWLQNMQDLGVCDEVKWTHDDNIPDVDLTFRNFEELFGSEHEPSRGSLVNDKNTADKQPTCAEFNRSCTSTAEEIPVPGASPVCVVLHQPNEANRDNYAGAPSQFEANNYLMRPSYSTSSFSVSRITGGSNSSEFKDDGLSPAFLQPQPVQGNPHDSDITKLDGKGNVMMRYKEKKVLRHEKQGLLHRFPRSKSDAKKRGRGQALKADSSSGNVTRSF